MAQVLTNKDFLAFAEKATKDFLTTADRAIDKIVEAKKDGAKRGDEWVRINRLFLWQRFGLSSLAIVGIGILGWNKILGTDVVGTLMAGVVASLFVTPKKD